MITICSLLQKFYDGYNSHNGSQGTNVKIQKLVTKYSIVEIQVINDCGLKQDNSIGKGETGSGIRGFTVNQCWQKFIDFEIHCMLEKLVDLYFWY